ncbi:hypothetical protein F4560_003674 [Saccharothrix ecbatanensis]|uniref:Uncharacterized protein n=1 Tax=Saccharothrix ecbatanensis TaxID=1105145 RepID=A0A7W9M1F7_9PSEU|nr:hypothetical protein [Saccharothrix ecbatanensis]
MLEIVLEPGLKALLEHKIQLGPAEDRFPDGHPA